MRESRYENDDNFSPYFWVIQLHTFCSNNLIFIKKNLIYIRKSIYAKKNIPQGKIIEREDIALLRPAIGFGPENLKKIIGKKAKKFIKIDSIIKKDHI